MLPDWNNDKAKPPKAWSVCSPEPKEWMVTHSQSTSESPRGENDETTIGGKP